MQQSALRLAEECATDMLERLAVLRLAEECATDL
jgi:hypothetical protein